MQIQSLDKLRSGLTELAQGRGRPEELEREIRRNMRAAKTDPEMVTELRLLLAQLYFWKREPAKSRAQYRKVLEHDPDSVHARIGIGHSFESISRLEMARKWFEAAYVAAEARQDFAGRLAALDVIAFNADERDDAQALSNALDAMCRALASGPRLDSLSVMIAEWLILKRIGLVALPFLECLIKHLLERGGYPWGTFYLALRPFFEIHRREGRTDAEISGILDKLRPLAANDATASDFDKGVKWAFDYSRHHYEVVFGARPNEAPEHPDTTQ